MKKLIVAVVFSMLVFVVNAQIVINNFEYSFLEDVIYFVGYNNKVYQVNTMDKTFIDLTKYIRLDETGYYVLMLPIPGQDPILKQNTEYFMIPGSNQFLYLADLDRINYLHNPNEDTMISNISATSYLTEKTSTGNIVYAPTNLLSKYFSTDKEFRYELIPSSLPWAIKNEEVGTTNLEIKFKNQTNGLIFLNGYIDLQKRSLYKKNSRVKELEITDTHSGKVVHITLLDSIQYQEIKLPFSSDSLHIKIISVYSGSKYTDVCISSIVPFFTDQISKQNKMYRTNESEIKDGLFLKEFQEIKKF